MDKKFKEVRNVLNMKKIISTGLLAGTLFASTSAFAAEPMGLTKIKKRINIVSKIK